MLPKTELKRLMLPRWFVFTKQQDDLIPPLKPGKLIEHAKDDLYTKKITFWKEERNQIAASDLAGTALIIDDVKDPDVLAAADFLIASKTASSVSKQIAKQILRREDKKTVEQVVDATDIKVRKKISDVRSQLRSFPNDPILLTNMAYYYSVLGQVEHALKAMNQALHLGLENRHVIRSAVRFFSHIKEPDRALHYLHSARITSRDPWVMAAEISVAELLNKGSNQAKRAREILKNSLPNVNLSELAASLGTIEYLSGNIKNARRNFSVALGLPTENTVAQYEWLGPRIGGDVDSQIRNKISNLFEADARRFFRQGEVSKALNSALRWHHFQPFSSTAATFGSFASSLVDAEHEKAVELLLLSEKASPYDFTIKNNLAYSYASIGKLSEANEKLNSIVQSSLTGHEKGILSATRGLLAIKSGRKDEGRTLYKDAIQQFEQLRETSSADLARLFWAREEYKTKEPLAGTKEIFDKALDKAEKGTTTEFRLIAQSIKKLMK